MNARRSIIFRSIAAIVAVSLVYEMAMPLAAMALTSGPAQPEFSSFEPVGTSDMVNTFTGQFTYNLPILSVPGPGGSGYPLSLSYHSGTSPEEEASWVGYGWTLNPGAITRTMRGFPDDYDSVKVRYWNKTRRNWTTTVAAKANLELFSNDRLGKFGAGGNVGLRYNNYKGFGYVAGFDMFWKGVTNLGYSESDGNGSFSAQVNPAGLINAIAPKWVYYDNKDMSGPPSPARPLIYPLVARWADRITNQIASSYISFGISPRPTNIARYYGASYNVAVSIEPNATFLPAGVEEGFSGSYSCQENYPLDTLSTYGYLYSAHAGAEDMMDYTVEREGPYTRRDMFLPIPFSAADYFSMTGEGLGGTFRAYNSNAGHFHPNHKESKVEIFQVGGSVNLGSEFGLGANIGVGKQSLTVDKWQGGMPSAGYAFSDPNGDDEPVFFRMSGDLGGNILFSNDDAPTRASFDGGGFWGFEEYNPVANDPELSGGAVSPVMNSGKRSGRSTYIGYSTTKEMQYQLSADRITRLSGTERSNLHSYNKNAESRSLGPKAGAFGEPEINGIGEFSVVTPSAMRYNFGLPVYSRKERNLQYGIADVDGAYVRNNYQAFGYYVPSKEGAVSVTGEERDEPYASMYLLTSIETPDYVDLLNDGPTPDDVGGYTLFQYTRSAGGEQKHDNNSHWNSTTAPDTNSWYRWRVPYNGLLYQRNSMSDPTDDQGSVTTGEKEVYYLKSIETKTHIAVFVTNEGVTIGDTTIAGSGQIRHDSYEASHFEYRAAGDSSATAAQVGTSQSPNKMRYLERIELYAKGEGGKLGRLIQTVHFDYQYSLSKGLPNAFKPSGASVSDGKLTLVRVYTEFNGVVGARISPYTFGYTYRSASDYASLPSELQTKYQSIVHFADSLDAGEQNPNYSPFNIDAWGNYQRNGHNRYNALRSWVDQVPDLNAFDPAAWQLKWIRLPSGGEIHIQYEQNTYSYVQDQPAMAMVSLTGMSGNKYYLNTGADLGVSDGSAKQRELLQAIREKYLDTVDGDKMYFKILFPMVGAADNVDRCNNEYISGYATVKSAGIDGSNRLWVELEGKNEDGTPMSPVNVLDNFVRSMRSGIAGTYCSVEGEGLTDAGNAVQNVMNLLGKVGQVFAPGISSATPNYQYSFIRIPLATKSRPVLSKRGGGVRVRRLLMFDKGIETGAASLYGSEYLYQADGASSGVATNEPSAIHGENALVGYLVKRRDQSFWEKIIAGRDREQFEGPIGESVLPGPSIGYSRVIVKNIHDGKTSNGLACNEFYTARDYPLNKQYDASVVAGRGASYTDLKEETDWAPLTTGIVNYNRANIWATQGYRFVMADMHGKPKRSGIYSSPVGKPDSLIPIATQRYEYFQPGDSIRMMYGIGTYKYEYPGKETEVVFEGRSVEDVTIDGSIETDAGVGVTPPTPIPLLVPWMSAFGNISYNEERMRTHVTCKVVHYPAILRKVEYFKDGITHSVENVAFDPATGRAVVTRQHDGYNGLTLQKSPSGHNRAYQSYELPAYLQYSAMGQKAKNERLKLRTGNGMVINKMNNGSSHWLSFNFSDPAASCRIGEQIGSGDLILVYKHGADGNVLWPLNSLGAYYVDKVIGNRVNITSPVYSYPAYGAIDSVDVYIVRSGKTNQLNVPTETITTYAQPTP